MSRLFFQRISSAIVVIYLLTSTAVIATPIDTASILNRPVPAWFGQAKFGIFIHWGVYSVPAYRPAQKNTQTGQLVLDGSYAEWYAPDVMYSPLKNDSFHYKTYGKNFEYFDFAPMFKAELYNPDAWADLFVKSGAKYVILTSKHCEGFCLWPSKSPYSKNWNAGETGPRRDVLGDLTRSVKSRGLKMGYYYSFLEYWSTPTQNWPANPDERMGYYVPKNVWDKHHIPFDRYPEHLHTHIKELVTNYNPDILWADAEWDFGADYWRSIELLDWIIKNSPNGTNLALNDRWYNGCRGKHVGYYTTEYGHGSENVSDNHPWEECRGMAYSFGYNRAENINDYHSAHELVDVLASTVSKGGNLLLNIGPAADGTIPVIMQERLLQLGEWLQINGEAIYETSAGSSALSAENGIKTYFTQKGKVIYALVMEPASGKVTIKGLDAKNVQSAELLGSPQKLVLKPTKGGLTINFVPECNRPQNTHTLKITLKQ